jgi:hypothetical protein
MYKLDPYEDLEERFARFERAAAKGHEESIWILSVVKEAKMEKRPFKEAFAETETPLGWYLAGKLSDFNSREEFDFYKKSAEGGCSWGQVGYGSYFQDGWYVQADAKVHLEWLTKAANQNNPRAMDWLGGWFRREEGDDNAEKAVSYYRVAAELGWDDSMECLAEMLRNGIGCEKDLRQAAIWGMQATDWASTCWEMLRDAGMAFEEETASNLDCDFNQFCYSLGWGVYWYQYGSGRWKARSDQEKSFGNHCLNYYCSCVELQQQSIFTFLLCWNRIGGMKDIGVLIGKMVWEGREENLVNTFCKIK